MISKYDQYPHYKYNGYVSGYVSSKDISKSAPL